MEALPPTRAADPGGGAAAAWPRAGSRRSSSRPSPREAGESKASIGYHFGNKAGLVTALVDSLAHESNRGAHRRDGRRAGRRGSACTRSSTARSRIAADAESFQSFFDVLPHALRDPDLRERVAALYDGYRETVLRCLDADGAARGAARCARSRCS